MKRYPQPNRAVSSFFMFMTFRSDLYFSNTNIIKNTKTDSGCFFFFFKLMKLHSQHTHKKNTQPFSQTIGNCAFHLRLLDFNAQQDHKKFIVGDIILLFLCNCYFFCFALFLAWSLHAVYVCRCGAPCCFSRLPLAELSYLFRPSVIHCPANAAVPSHTSAFTLCSHCQLLT